MNQEALMNTASCFESTKSWFILLSRPSIAASTSHIRKPHFLNWAGDLFQHCVCDHARRYTVAAVAGRGRNTGQRPVFQGVCVFHSDDCSSSINHWPRTATAATTEA